MIGYSLQYSWTSLVAQLVKNLLSMQETWVRSLDWKDPLEKEMATHWNILDPGKAHRASGAGLKQASAFRPQSEFAVLSICWERWGDATELSLGD